MDSFTSTFAQMAKDIFSLAWNVQEMLWDKIGFTSIFIQLVVVVLAVRFLIMPAFNGVGSLSIGSPSSEIDDDKEASHYNTMTDWAQDNSDKWG